TEVAGSSVNGAYGPTVASCHPWLAAHFTVTMWSVKYVPKPGLANTSATRSGLAGLACGTCLNCVVVVMVRRYSSLGRPLVGRPSVSGTPHTRGTRSTMAL